MLSYQHAYHAGNLADVHKHALLAWTLDYLVQKPKPLSYIETHSGRGLYQLDAAEALKTGEAAKGIARTESWFGADHPYRRALAHARAQDGPRAYPGSPHIASFLLRAEDTLHLAELHPAEVGALRDNVPAAHIQQRDGLEMVLAISPPTPRRGICLMDPSYEIKDDYRALPVTIAHLHRKWSVGVVMLWYPILTDAPHKPMLANLRETAPEALVHEVRFPPAREGHRMVGSGMFVINPPYGMDKAATDLSQKFATLKP